MRLLRGFLFAFALSLGTSRALIHTSCSLCDETRLQFYPRDGDAQHRYIDPLVDVYTDLSFRALFSDVLPCEDILSDVDVGRCRSFPLVCEQCTSNCWAACFTIVIFIADELLNTLVESRKEKLHQGDVCNENLLQYTEDALDAVDEGIALFLFSLESFSGKNDVFLAF